MRIYVANMITSLSRRAHAVLCRYAPRLGVNACECRAAVLTPQQRVQAGASARKKERLCAVLQRAFVALLRAYSAYAAYFAPRCRYARAIWRRDDPCF